MSSKSFGLTSFIPSITSVTKTETVRRAPTSGRPALHGRPASRTAAATRTAPVSRATAGRSRSINNNWVSVASAMAIAAIVVGLGFYVYTINASASKGYDLKKQQALMEELNETQKRLVVQQAALGSIVKVNDVASTDGMVPVSGEEFLSANQLSSR